MGIESEAFFEGQPLGVARVELVSEEAAKLALQTLHRLNIGGRTVNCLRAQRNTTFTTGTDDYEIR
jgi:hypothetical protein